MIKFKSKFVNENTFASTKPQELKISCPILEIKIGDIEIKFEEESIREYFLDRRTTLIQCYEHLDVYAHRLKGTSPEFKKPFLEIAKNYFYSKDERELIVKFQKNDLLNLKNNTLSLNDKNFEIFFPNKDIFVLNFIIEH